MNVKQFYKYVFVFLLSVFVFTGCGSDNDGGEFVNISEGSDLSTSLRVLDSIRETISQNEIKTLLENNETTYTKSFTLDDKKTKVKLSFDLLENNVTKDIKLDVEKLDYKEGILWAKIIKLSSNTSLKNIEIEVLNNSEVANKSYRKVIDSSSNKYTVATMGEAPIAFSFESNFLDILYDLKLNLKNNKYILSAKLKNKIKQLHLQVFDNNKNEVSNKSISNTKDIEFLFNKIDERYNVNFYITTPPFYNKRISLFSLVLTTDFITDNEIISKKTLSQTRVNENDILNNFMESDERKYPFIMNETVTHRITDFDKLMLYKNIIPTKTKWQNTSYIPHGDDGRMPLILVHGWNGDKGMTDPSKLLLWENSEFHYWHNFLAFYLTSEEVQKKYHIYLYRYTSYKHIPYNAKIFSSLLEEISASTTDLGKGLNKNDGVTIMGHSMGGMVARAMIEDFNGLGINAEKLKKLITLDSPHRGSVGSMDTRLANFPKDLDTHGAMDLNYDNFDNNFNSTKLEELYTARRVKNSLADYDTVYCQKLYPSKTLNECLAKTANPYMRYLNDKLFVDKKDKYNKKYIYYTAWSVTNANKFPNFINNGVFDIATAYMASYGYSAGGAETVGSSLFIANDSLGQNLNAKIFTYPLYSDSEGIYHKDVSLGADFSISIITNSVGKDHSYGVPYRLFWDYDHETIFNGTAHDEDYVPIVDGLLTTPHPSRGAWDDYINSNSVFTTDTDKDTLFNSHREDYIKGAMKIRYGQEPTDVSNLNPLTYEPVFLVLEKDLLTSVTNGDIDEDKLPDEWEEANGLRWVNADDANEDSDNDGLTNLQEYNNGTNSTDPQNEDSDGDGFKDGEEVTAGTNPNDKDDYPYEKFSLTLDSTTSTNFNLSWTAPTGVTKYKLCFSSIDEVSYETAQTCDSLIDGSFLSETTSTTLSFNGDSLGNLLQSSNDYYMRVVAYNDSDEVVGVSSEVIGKLNNSNNGSLNTIPLNLNNFNRKTCGNTEIVGDSIVVYGTGYRQGNGIASIDSFNFNNSDTYVKWKANGDNSYAHYNIYISGLVSEQTKTTNHSYNSSYLISDDTWYYTHYKVNSDKTFTITTSTDDYDTNVIIDTEGSLTDEQFRFVENTNIVVAFGDNYSGTSASMTVAKIKTTALKNIKSNNEKLSYSFDDSTNIPSTLSIKSDKWSIVSNNSYNGTNSLLGKSSNQLDLILNVNSINRVSFKYRVNMNTEYKGFYTYLDNIYTTIGSNGTSGCWLNADIPIYQNSANKLTLRLTDNGYSSEETKVWIDDLKLYTK